MAGNRINVVLSLDTSAFTRAMNQATRNMERFGSRLEGIGRSLTTRLTLPIVGVGAAAVQAFAKFEGLTKGLEAIATEADPAAKQLERLRKIALNPGISLEQAVAGSIRLQAVGQSAADAERTLLQFSKAVALAGGTAEDLDVVTRQLSQIQSKGRILSEDFLVIAERVPAIGLALETAFGTKNIEAIRNSGISASDFVKRLTEGIANTEAFQKVTGGLANSFDNFRQSISAALVQLGGAIDKSVDLKGAMNDLSGFVNRAVDSFRSLNPETQKFIVVGAGIAAAIGPALLTIGSLVRLLPLLASGFAALTGPIGLTIIAITTLLALLAKFDAEKFTRGLGGVRDSATGFSISKTAAGLAGKDAGSSFVEGFNNELKGISALEAIGAQVPGRTTQLSPFVKAPVSAVPKVDFPKLPTTPLADAGKQLEEPLRFSVELRRNINGLIEDGKILEGVFRKIPLAFKPIQELKTNALSQVNNVLAQYGDNVQGLGFASDILSSKIGEIQSRLFELAANGYGATNEEVVRLTESLGILTAKQEEVQTGIQSLSDANKSFLETAAFLTDNINAAFSGFFETILSGGQNAFKAFGEILKKVVAQLLKAVATALALAIIFSIISGGAGGAIGKLGKTFEFTKGGFGGLFGGIFKGISGFASGGLVTGPTLALVGEGAGTTRSNPEVIAPLDQLRAMLGDLGGGAFVASARISGDDLMLLVERAQRNRAR